ncbi:hypothetical protein AADZ84_06780 [Colwelliaceae bacterium MEBiC 14330]
MKKNDNIAVIQEITEELPSSMIEKCPKDESTQAPLIRYFSISDEATESYVLGYN